MSSRCSLSKAPSIVPPDGHKIIQTATSDPRVFYDLLPSGASRTGSAAAATTRRGYFDAEVEAARAYDRLAVAWFGEFACLNFPREWPPDRRTQVHAQRQEKGDEAPGARGERSEYRLQAGKTSPTRVNAGLPTPDPQAPGRSARAKGKRRKVESKGGKPRRARRTRRGEKTREV
jgi:hypothetical protein